MDSQESTSFIPRMAQLVLMRLRRLFVRVTGIGLIEDYSPLLLRYQKFIRQTISRYESDIYQLKAYSSFPDLYSRFRKPFFIELEEEARSIIGDHSWRITEPERLVTDLRCLRENAMDNFKKMVEQVPPPGSLIH
jgi:hypothetical protein